MGMVPAMLAKQKGARLDHVLIVDPDKSERARVRRLLSEAKVAPLQISEAQAVEEAAKAYHAERDKRPSVILIALDLAGEHGDEWLNEIRGSSKILKTPVV